MAVVVEAPQQLALFTQERLPKRPYVTNDPKFGLSVRGCDKAIAEWPFIQPNPPALRYRIVFDIDRPGALLAAEDAHVAPFNWAAVNPENGHVHAAYEIGVPVVMSDAGRQKVVRFAAAIEHAYMNRLGADIGYAGLVCKNPRHAHWKTYEHRVEPYDLAELAEWVTLPTKITNKDLIASPMGRNCTLFDRVRLWAYKNIRNYRKGDYEAWMRAVELQAEVFNDFPTTLIFNEVKHVAKSVGKWVWRNFTPSDIATSDAKFSALQAHRGHAGGVQSGLTRAEKALTRMNAAAELKAQGLTQKAIARELGITQQSVSLLLKNARIAEEQIQRISSK